MLLNNTKKFKSLFTLTLLAKVVSVFLIAFILLTFSFTSAAELSSRSVTIGSSLPGAVTNHDFRFNTISGSNVGSIKFDYCSDTPLFGAPCTAPTGLIVNTATILQQSLGNGFTVSGVSTPSTLIITRNPAISGGPASAIFRFGNITNQTTSSQTVYVRVSTHASMDGTGPEIDKGSVGYSTVPGVGVGGYVPPFLTFCTGVTVALDCSVVNGSILGLGELSENYQSTASSQFSASTNDPTGYNTYVSGGTMTAGNEVIPALTANSPGIAGVSQFGMNLRSNSSPAVGANVSGPGTGVPAVFYNSPNSFRYVNGERIAGSSLPTEFNRFTVSYVVNVSADQAPGVYASSYTYTAVASF